MFADRIGGEALSEIDQYLQAGWIRCQIEAAVDFGLQRYKSLKRITKNRVFKKK